MQSRYNCLLFDVDGTLLDFNEAEREAIVGTLGKFGLPADDDVAARFSAINAELWAQLEKGEIKKDRLVVQRFKTLLAELSAAGDAVRMNSEYMTRLSEAAPMMPGADEMLAELAEFATLAVATNAVQRVQLNRLEKSGLLPYFDEVFVSERLGVSKPAPAFFTLALQRLGIVNKSRVLVVGDSLSADIKGGQNAGLHTCWYNPGALPLPAGVRPPTHTVNSYPQLILTAVGEEALKHARDREKRHTV